MGLPSFLGSSEKCIRQGQDTNPKNRMRKNDTYAAFIMQIRVRQRFKAMKTYFIQLESTIKVILGQ